MAKKSKYLAKIWFRHGVTGELYKPGDEVVLPDQYLQEMLNNGMIAEYVVDDRETPVITPSETATLKKPTKTATKKPSEPKKKIAKKPKKATDKK